MARKITVTLVQNGHNNGTLELGGCGLWLTSMGSKAFATCYGVNLARRQKLGAGIFPKWESRAGGRRNSGWRAAGDRTQEAERRTQNAGGRRLLLLAVFCSSGLLRGEARGGRGGRRKERGTRRGSCGHRHTIPARQPRGQTRAQWPGAASRRGSAGSSVACPPAPVSCRGCGTVARGSVRSVRMVGTAPSRLRV